MKTLITIISIAMLAVFLPLQANVLHDAVSRAEYDTVKQLLKVKPELLNSQDDAGSTPLHIAAKTGNKKIAKYLLKKGADIEAGDKELTTPLQLAASENQLDMVKYLISKGANIQFQDQNGLSALQWAAYRGHTEIVEYLAKKGADIEAAKPVNLSRALHGAANGGHLETVKWLVEHGAEIDPINAGGYSPLLSAAATGQLEIVKYLQEQGANLNVQLEWGANALFFAADQGNLELAEYLISNGLPVNPESPESRPALFAATWRNNVDMIELLVKNGADVNWVNDQNGRAILWTAYEGSVDAAKVLLKHGADPNFETDNGQIPLVVGAIRGYADLVQALIDGGADVSMTEPYYGFTALHYAAVKGFGEIATILLKSGAEVNAPDEKGRTPLYYASQYRNREVAKLISAKGGRSDIPVEHPSENQLAKTALGSGEAMLWYTGHCGWAIKTQNHLMVFDYWNPVCEADNPCLANGTICCKELADQDVAVFVTHEHQDHYDSTIFTWEDKLDNIEYIFGFQPENLPQWAPQYYSGQDYTYTAPRTQTALDGMKISTIKSNDAGVGFLVEVDGVKIYHAGDHAGWASDEDKHEFTDEIDYLAKIEDDVDFAFVNVTGCRHSGHPDELFQSNLYTLHKLHPKVLIPTHGLDNEHVYRDFADRIRAEDEEVEIYSPSFKGDHFRYATNSGIVLSQK